MSNSSYKPPANQPKIIIKPYTVLTKTKIRQAGTKKIVDNFCFFPLFKTSFFLLLGQKKSRIKLQLLNLGFKQKL